MSSVQQRIAAIAAIVGPQGMVAAAESAAYASDWRKRYVGKPLAVVRPASTALNISLRQPSIGWR